MLVGKPVIKGTRLAAEFTVRTDDLEVWPDKQILRPHGKPQHRHQRVLPCGSVSLCPRYERGFHALGGTIS